MSVKTYKPTLFLSLLILGTFACVAILKPNSVTQNQKQKTMGFINEKVIRTHKLSPGFRFEINSDMPTPIPIDSSFQLNAEIATDVPMSNVSFTWAIPDGVEVMSGAINGTIPSIETTEKRSLSVTLINRTAENKIITLFITDGSKTKISAQFHTEKQDAIKQEMSEIYQRNQEYLNDNPDVIKGFK